MDERKRDERFPGNSHAKIVPKEVEKKVEKVANGRVVTRKKSFGEKMAETFLAADWSDIYRHIVFDVLIPEAKNMLSDIIHGSTNMMLFGDRRGDRTDRSRGQSYVRTSMTDYSRYSSDRNRDDKQVNRPISRNVVDDLIFDSRGEAEEVLSNMLDLIAKYNVASVKDLYIFANVPSDFTKEKWGWFDLREATVDRVQGGYLLKLPKPCVIDP